MTEMTETRHISWILSAALFSLVGCAASKAPPPSMPEARPLNVGPQAADREVDTSSESSADMPAGGNVPGPEDDGVFERATAEPGSIGTLGARCDTDAHCPQGAWCATETTERRCAPRPVVGGVEMPFQWMPSGTFTMGSPVDEVRRHASEAEVSVSLTRDTFVQRTPVTQAQWAAVAEAWNTRSAEERTLSGWSNAAPALGTTPSCFRSANEMHCTTEGLSPHHPVERVSWWDAVVFANVLSVLEGLQPCYELVACEAGRGDSRVGVGCSDARDFCSDTFRCSDVTFVGTRCTGYRLPTEAEWEYAARGGTQTVTYRGDYDRVDCPVSLPVLDPVAWYVCNSDRRTHAVGEKAPNAWGLHDMLGNVWEWTWTWYSHAHAGGLDPLGPATGDARVVRGGSWRNSAQFLRSASRHFEEPDYRGHMHGFRLVRTVAP